MDRNFFLAVGLSFAVLVLWTMYTESTAPPVEPAPATATREAEPPSLPAGPAALPPATDWVVVARPGAAQLDSPALHAELAALAAR